MPKSWLFCLCLALMATWCASGSLAFHTSILGCTSSHVQTRKSSCTMPLRCSLATGEAMGHGGSLAVDRRRFLAALTGIATAYIGSAPNTASAEEKAKKEEDKAVAPPVDATPTISLKDFYTALYAQEVKSVEFDGAKFDRAYVTLNKGGVFLIGEGYQQESAINSSGPQQVLAKIKNEIKAGNPVTWSWTVATAFKNKSQKKASAKEAAKVESGKEAAAGSNSTAPAIAPTNQDGGVKGEDKSKAPQESEKKGGGFFFSLPAPPKSL